MSTLPTPSAIALREARARILGISVDQLLDHDNRVIHIAAVAQERGLTIDDARAFVQDQEQLAREERLQEAFRSGQLDAEEQWYFDQRTV